jgi:hypothetical protein
MDYLNILYYSSPGRSEGNRQEFHLGYNASTFEIRSLERKSSRSFSIILSPYSMLNTICSLNRLLNYPLFKQTRETVESVNIVLSRMQ